MSTISGEDHKAAERGFTIAQYDLGVAYDNGKGLKKSYADAVKWYRKAADGDPQAMKNAAQPKQRMTPEQVTQARNKLTGWQQKNPKPVAPPLQPEEGEPTISL